VRGIGAGGSPEVGRAIPWAARLPRPRQNRAARLLLAGEGGRRPAKPSSRRSPALRLCLERIVGPYRERAVEFTMPPIRNAADLAGPKG
jgi:hypothetical protein